MQPPPAPSPPPPPPPPTSPPSLSLFLLLSLSSTYRQNSLRDFSVSPMPARPRHRTYIGDVRKRQFRRDGYVSLNLNVCLSRRRALLRRIRINIVPCVPCARRYTISYIDASPVVYASVLHAHSYAFPIRIHDAGAR